jgi:6,7-dimethyl-8-ribityllumazine synthase
MGKTIQNQAVSVTGISELLSGARIDAGEPACKPNSGGWPGALAPCTVATVGKYIARQADGHGRKLAITVARFNESITTALLQGAMECLVQHHVQEQDITVCHVPGAFELPLACRRLAVSGVYDAVLALGAVIRGETPHFDYICTETARGIMQVNSDTNVPVIFGVLTCETEEQAMARAGGRLGNKGAEAAIAALEMAALAEGLGAQKDPGKYGHQA